MSYLASLLISRAYNLSGIVARDLETVSGSQTEDGLFLLNELLEFMSCDLKKIPYWQKTTFSLIAGQEVYFLANLFQIETFTFNIGAVRFPTTELQRVQYFGSGRVDNIQSLPFEWHLERTTGGSNFYVYFLPDQNYVCTLTGKYALTDVSLNTDMSSVYDGFYLAYLRHALAEKICLENDIQFDQGKMRKMMSMGKRLETVSPPDLTLTKIKFINGSQPFDWQHVNISPGYDVL